MYWSWSAWKSGFIKSTLLLPWDDNCTSTCKGAIIITSWNKVLDMVKGNRVILYHFDRADKPSPLEADFCATILPSICVVVGPCGVVVGTGVAALAVGELADLILWRKSLCFALNLFLILPNLGWAVVWADVAKLMGFDDWNWLPPLWELTTNPRVARTKACKHSHSYV